MDWPTVILILGILGIIAATLAGGKLKVTKEGVEYDTPGLAKWLERAREDKGVPSSGPQAEDTPRGSRATAAGAPAATPDAMARSLGKPRIPRARVLWVDDNPLNNVYERQALASLGIFADSYTTNAEGERAMEAAAFDLVISDIGRDGGAESGWDLLATVHQRWPRVPFVFYAGDAGPERQDRAQREGALGITALPDDLVKMVVGALAGGAGAHG